MLLAALSLLKLQVRGHGATLAGGVAHLAWVGPAHAGVVPPVLPPVICSCPQLHTAIREGVPPAELGLSSGSALLNSLRECLMALACAGEESSAVVQHAAQGVLSACWRVLMPKVAERAGALSSLLRAAKGGWVVDVGGARLHGWVGCDDVGGAGSHGWVGCDDVGGARLHGWVGCDGVGGARSHRWVGCVDVGGARSHGWLVVLCCIVLAQAATWCGHQASSSCWSSL